MLAAHGPWLLAASAGEARDQVPHADGGQQWPVPVGRLEGEDDGQGRDAGQDGHEGEGGGDEEGQDGGGTPLVVRVDKDDEQEEGEDDGETVGGICLVNTEF